MWCIKQIKAVVPVVPNIFLQDVQEEGGRLRLSWSQTFPLLWMWKCEAWPHVGADGEQSQLLHADGPQAVVWSLGRSQHVLCFYS